MSYTMPLQCGCAVYVSCHPATGVGHERVIQAHGRDCHHRRHNVGARLYQWEILPDQRQPPVLHWNDDADAFAPVT